MTLAYDPLGRLRQTVAGSATTQFLYDGDRLVAEYDGSTILRRYVHGSGVDEPILWYEGSGFTDRRHLIADRQGSIVAEQGAATSLYRYGPYGEPESWAGARFRYTGQAALPEVQLYHYKARVYDPVLGRFLQTDPIGYEDDLNRYAYVRNDPLNQADPDGRQAALIGVELKRGVRGTEVDASRPPGETGPMDAGGALEVGIAIGATEDGRLGVRLYETETVGGIWGNSSDLQVTLTPAPVDQIDGADVGIANVDAPIGAGRLDGGAGVQLRGSDAGLSLEAQFSAGTGMAQEVGSVSITRSADILTPALDALGDALGALRSMRASERLEDDD